MTSKIFYKSKETLISEQYSRILRLFFGINGIIIRDTKSKGGRKMAVEVTKTMTIGELLQYINKTADNYPGIKKGIKPSLSDVIKENSIEAALEYKTVFGEKFVPVWDKTSDSCILLVSDGHGGHLLRDINGSTLPPAMSYNLCQISTESDGGYVVGKYDIISWQNNYSKSALQS